MLLVDSKPVGLNLWVVVGLFSGVLATGASNSNAQESGATSDTEAGKETAATVEPDSGKVVGAAEDLSTQDDGSGVSAAAAEAELAGESIDTRPQWGLQGFAGIHGYSSNSILGVEGRSSISNSFLIGLRYWQRLGDIVQVEGELPFGVSTSRDQVATLFVGMPRIHGRLKPFGDFQGTPSVVLGAGLPFVTSTKQSSVTSDVHVAAYTGLGLGFRLRGLRIGVEARYVGLLGRGDALLAHEWEGLLTLGFRTKKKAPKVAAMPMDRDGDGVDDTLDRCPRRAEDLDGFEDEDGCPELDNDGDNVLDGLDECSNEPETWNGFQDDDGCPDEVVDEVRLLEGVISGLRFEAGSGVMEEEGYKELEALASMLKKQPSIKIKLYGHVDSREASGEEAEELAIQRAESVREFLIEEGVGFGRIRAFGRGASEPFADNSTGAGRRANRRVELHIAQQGEDEEQ